MYRGEKMRVVNVTELRNHLPKYLSFVSMGNEILVTSHGNVIARILPPADSKSDAITALKKLRKRCRIGDVIAPIDEDWEAEQ
jgi:prevent-host-death family protein